MRQPKRFDYRLNIRFRQRDYTCLVVTATRCGQTPAELARALLVNGLRREWEEAMCCEHAEEADR